MTGNKQPNREEVLTFASENSVQKAAQKYGVSTKTIYQWQGKTEGNKMGISIETEGEYLVIRVPKKMALREALGGLI